MNCPTGTHCLSPIGAARLYGDVLFHTDSSRTPIVATPAVARQAASGDSRVEARPRRGAAKQFGAHLEALARRQRTGSSAQHSGLARSQGVCRMLQGILDGRNYRGELGSSSLRAELVPSVGRSHAMPSSLPRILQAQAVSFAGPSTGCRVEKKTNSAILTTTLRNYM